MATPTVLVMEDNDGIREIIVRAFTKAGFEVYQAATIREARHLLEERQYSVFTSDIRLPDGDGIELLREYFDRLTQAGTRVIVMSAEDHYRIAAEEIGVEFFLSKPVSYVMLKRFAERLA